MQQGSGFLLILVGLLFLWVVVSGKFDLMETFFLQLFDLTPTPAAGTKTPAPTPKNDLQNNPFFGILNGAL